MRVLPAVIILVLAATPAFAHRLDEYLQSTILSIEKNRLEAQITLTPGVAVFPAIVASIDRDADGRISGKEQLAYAEAVLRDLSFVIDGDRLTPQLLAMNFPAIGALKEGVGEIRLALHADLPAGARRRSLIFENTHQPGIAAYQVNSLVPNDPMIRIAAQRRNYSQSHYELQYEQTGIPSDAPSVASWSERIGWVGLLGLLLSTQLAFRRRYRQTSSNETDPIR